MPFILKWMDNLQWNECHQKFCHLFFIFNLICCKFVTLKCKTKSLNFPILLDVTLIRPSLPWSHSTYWKKYLIAFRQILPKILPAVYIFNNTIMTNLKKFIWNKSLNTKQCPAGLSPRILSLNLYAKT